MNYNHVINHLPIHKAALTDDWESVSQIFDKDPELMTTPISYLGETPLMMAVGTNKSHNFVKQLVDRIVAVNAVDKLFLASSRGDNPLHRASMVGNTVDARVLVERSPDMIRIPNADGYTPVILAAWHRNKGILQFLLKETADLGHEEEGSSLYSGVAGGDLITLTIHAGFLDVALQIIAKHPDIVIEEDAKSVTALEVLGSKPELFPSGSTLGFWSRLIYLFIPINKRSQEGAQPNLFSKCTTGFWSILHYLAPSIKDIHDIKLTHYQSKRLTKEICATILRKRDHNLTWKILGSATSAAVQHGTPEVIEECISTYPDIIWYTEKGFHLSLEAITQRQEQVYNILFQSDVHKAAQANLMDKEEKENSLHKAAKLAPPHRINVMTGAALQMQRELQWYKEVENFVEPSFKKAQNINKKTPKMVFMEEHKDLLDEAEQWMKDVSASSTVVAALIITMAFAGAFTLPGGNQDDGNPLFLNKGTFMLFIISDTIALFSSTASVVMFLGILTARFAPDDFLYALPKRMTIGLVFLFMSLAATMIAFSATLALVLKDKVTWIAAPLVVVSCVPVALFGWLQFPLLIELVYSTYGPSIFKQKKNE
ncbi:putative ankyrin repeat-containing domain, PGG domain, ankyrin repeat-containing domain superfamily [Helianthus debilis subsp. tardiflorus]